MSQVLLVIDDSVDVHRLLEVRLKPEELVLEHALDAEQGLRKARELVPDLVLLDVDMPGMTGFEVCRRLKEDPVTAALPIIFLTGTADVEAKVRGFDLGAIDFVTKPFEPAELRARVRAALRTKRLQDMLAARARLDGLTGLWNRAYFQERLAAEIAAVRRYDRRLALVFLDLDRFKHLNDTYGHPFGDLVLQRVGEILPGSVRVSDTACRYGGEEFVLLLQEASNDDATVVCRRVQDRLAASRLQARGQPVSVTSSFGIASSALFSAHELSEMSLLAAADQALYRAKGLGRNRICVATPADLAAHAAPL